MRTEPGEQLLDQLKKEKPELFRKQQGRDQSGHEWRKHSSGSTYWRISKSKALEHLQAPVWITQVVEFHFPRLDRPQRAPAGIMLDLRAGRLPAIRGPHSQETPKISAAEIPAMNNGEANDAQEHTFNRDLKCSLLSGLCLWETQITFHRSTSRGQRAQKVDQLFYQMKLEIIEWKSWNLWENGVWAHTRVLDKLHHTDLEELNLGPHDSSTLPKNWVVTTSVPSI